MCGCDESIEEILAIINDKHDGCGLVALCSCLIISAHNQGYSKQAAVEAFATSWDRFEEQRRQLH